MPTTDGGKHGFVFLSHGVHGFDVKLEIGGVQTTISQRITK